MNLMGCGKDKATKLFRELDKDGIGLIERKKQGQGRPFRSVFFFSVLLGAEKSQSRPRVSSGADCGISAVKSAALSSGLDR